MKEHKIKENKFISDLSLLLSNNLLLQNTMIRKIYWPETLIILFLILLFLLYTSSSELTVYFLLWLCSLHKATILLSTVCKQARQYLF